MNSQVTEKIKKLDAPDLITIGAGMSRTISISNTRNITASKKNRVEKGSRALSLGSKPHSKGVLFSRSLNLRDLRI